MSFTDEDWCEMYAELEEKLAEARRTSAKWKELAKRSRRWYVWAMANPGLALAKMVMIANTKDPPNDAAMAVGAQACEAMGWAFLEYLNANPHAPNYLEATLIGKPEQPLYVTVQRPSGKTPHQMRMEAEAERDKLRAELEGLKAQGECRS